MKHALSILVGFTAAAFLFAAPAAAEQNNGGAGVRLAPLDSGPELAQCMQRCQQLYADPRDPYGAVSSPQGYACLQTCHAQFPN